MKRLGISLVIITFPIGVKGGVVLLTLYTYIYISEDRSRPPIWSMRRETVVRYIFFACNGYFVETIMLSWFISNLDRKTKCGKS